jgi:hypothetical protein
VCVYDSYCCTYSWDSLCVDEVDSYSCGTCGSTAGDCCEVHSEPGCSDASVEACVCAYDSYCCTTSWDSLCVSEVTSYSCGTC